MDSGQPRLRNLGVCAKFGIMCLIITLLGGYAASFKHMVDHHSKRDEQPGLTMDDIRGAYHGVRRIAPMLTALERNHPADMEVERLDPLLPEDRQVLLDWLSSDRISEDYDNLDLGDFSPAEIIELNCRDCHSRQPKMGEGLPPRIPFDHWDDVKAVAFSREINPTSIEILTTSTHTHALTMGILTFAVCGLLLATTYPRFLVHACIGLLGLSLLADVGGQWLARSWEPGVWVIVIAGGVYGGLSVLSLLLVLLEMWLPPKRTG